MLEEDRTTGTGREASGIDDHLIHSAVIPGTFLYWPLPVLSEHRQSRTSVGYPTPSQHMIVQSETCKEKIGNGVLSLVCRGSHTDINSHLKSAFTLRDLLPGFYPSSSSSRGLLLLPPPPPLLLVLFHQCTHRHISRRHRTDGPPA